MPSSRVLCALLVLATALSAGAADAGPPAVAQAPSADELLAQVVSQLPRDPLVVKGDIVVRRQRGVVVRELGFTMDLDWGATPSSARYRVLSPDGRELESMTVTRDGTLPRFAFTRMAQAAPLPDLFAPIQGSDVSWMDLTLSFLWWRGGRVVGDDEVKGRSCFIVDVPAPAAAPGQPPLAGYSKVRVWIDRQVRMLLQAEGFDADGKSVRRLWVSSLKKMSSRWMVKDLEVQGTQSTHRTKLHVRELSGEGVEGETDGSAGAGEAAGGGDALLP